MLNLLKFLKGKKMELFKYSDVVQVQSNRTPEQELDIYKEAVATGRCLEQREMIEKSLKNKLEQYAAICKTHPEEKMDAGEIEQLETLRKRYPDDK